MASPFDSMASKLLLPGEQMWRKIAEIALVGFEDLFVKHIPCDNIAIAA